MAMIRNVFSVNNRKLENTSAHNFFYIGEIGVPYEGTTPVFVAIDNTISAEIPDGYLWLKLEDKYLTQWERLCLRRHIGDEGCSLLAITNVHEMIKKVITGSTDMRATVERYCYERWNDTIVTAETNGPALTILASVLRKEEVPCLYKGNKTRTLFHADYTFALHCYHWPNKAKGMVSFFQNDVLSQFS